jgi:hypothetical protein
VASSSGTVSTPGGSSGSLSSSAGSSSTPLGSSSGGLSSSSGSDMAGSGYDATTGQAGTGSGQFQFGPVVPLMASPPGLAGFAFIVNDKLQSPLSCPTANWEYPTAAAACNVMAPPCPGIFDVQISNTSQYPLAYTAQSRWNIGDGARQPPGVNFGNMGELSGVLATNEHVDVTSVYLGGIVAVLGSSAPFSGPDAGKYVADEGTIAWPAGVAGSEGSSTMYVAEIEVVDSCQTPTTVW